jgi:hypothetical protein
VKIISLEKNDRKQIIATVLNCNKELRIFADKLEGLPKAIVKACHFATYDDVKMDLELNYADFK